MLLFYFELTNLCKRCTFWFVRKILDLHQHFITPFDLSREIFAVYQRGGVVDYLLTTNNIRVNTLFIYTTKVTLGSD